MKKALVVVGLGFGDEGKGLVTDYLCGAFENPIVIRYNGGQQAGHTVITKEGKRHVFSNFGAGTFRGVPTYWSNYCSFAPAFFLDELDILPGKPRIYLDKLSPVTTHYDVLFNRAIEATRDKARYGSCGLGFGATIERHRISEVSLIANDLLSPLTLSEKLQRIRAYYQHKINTETKFNFEEFDNDNEDKNFLVYAEEIRELISQNVVSLVSEKDLFSSNHSWATYIFEGAQGILLDVCYGNYPYVTKSNTTTKNAYEIIQRNFKPTNIQTEVYYVTRAYQTRHGEGLFKQYKPPLELINNDLETNLDNEYQGIFRTSYLNIEDLNYCLKCDSKFSSAARKHLVITCLDHLKTKVISAYKNEVKIEIIPACLIDYLDCQFESCLLSYSNCADDLNKS